MARSQKGSQLVSAYDSGGALAFRNKLINASFAVNQRVYSSGAATSGYNQYTLDRWRVVTSGQNLSWTTSGGVITATAPADGIEQVIEGNNLVTGTYVLNWTGTATATVGGSAVSKGGTVSVTGGSNLTIKFSGGTVSLPQFELGTQSTTFEHRPFGLELLLCQRYYCKTFSYATAPAQNAGTTGALVAVAPATGLAIIVNWNFPVTMRATPTITTFNPSAANADWSANPSSPTASSIGGGEQSASILGQTNTSSGNAYYIQLTASIEL